jgi:hypothetical protein
VCFSPRKLPPKSLSRVYSPDHLHHIINFTPNYTVLYFSQIYHLCNLLLIHYFDYIFTSQH